MLILCSACPGGLDEDPDAGETDGGVDGECLYFCGVEETCGLRTFDACLAASCPAGVWNASSADGCIDAASDCAAIALCPCAARCEADEECLGSADPECVSDCTTLAEQTPTSAYVESRCVIDSECTEIALCTDF